MPEEVEFLKDSLSQSPTGHFAGVAAQDLAEYVADGRVPWAESPIERIEHVLVSLKKPCPHALRALRALVDARELRRLGVPLEKRIARALQDTRGCLQVAFVFGSYASNRQGSESDIDLMVIGAVSLRELTPGLKRAERELDRQINVVIYSEDEWRKRNQERNPFVVQAARGKKIFVKGGCDELAAMAG
jgi:predicted nucleotidyltransferase